MKVKRASPGARPPRPQGKGKWARAPRPPPMAGIRHLGANAK